MNNLDLISQYPEQKLEQNKIYFKKLKDKYKISIEERPKEKRTSLEDYLNSRNEKKLIRYLKKIEVSQHFRPKEEQKVSVLLSLIQQSTVLFELDKELFSKCLEYSLIDLPLDSNIVQFLGEGLLEDVIQTVKEHDFEGARIVFHIAKSLQQDLLK